ncbi:MAG: hypothetical protein EOO38_22110 [Cytophagaceae bacterium]|nr:MAG: hypothetical protein EOO38_22110 [Cytophagaceae bacterium]
MDFTRYKGYYYLTTKYYPLGTRRVMAEKQEELQPGQQSLLRRIVDSAHEPLLVLTASLRVAIANRSFCRTFQITSEAAQGVPLDAINNGQWDIPALHRLLEEVRASGKSCCIS